MTDEVKERLFEPFFTTKEQGKGTGLGLATCYGIIEQSGGHIVVESELGHGTTFKIYMPIVKQAADVLQKRPVSTEWPKGTETVLLVEDEPGVRELGVRVLRMLRYNVVEAENGVH